MQRVTQKSWQSTCYIFHILFNISIENYWKTMAVTIIIIMAQEVS